ncbi:MAG: hypothetical protein ABI068_09090 [Ktedonobacterales bacterium]
MARIGQAARLTNNPQGAQDGASIHAAPDIARQPRRFWADFAIHPAHVAALLQLRWKLTSRGYRRNVAQIIGLVLLLIFLVGLGGGAATMTALGYVFLPHINAIQLLFATLAGLYLVWAALPLLQYTVNEGLDVTKLQAYPLTRGEQMVSLTLATLLDPSVIALLGLYVAIVIGWHASLLATIITVVALALAYVHTVGFSQLALAAFMGLLRSRRYRDLTIIVFALAGASCSLFQQFAIRAVNGNTIAAVENLRLVPYLQWIPPGMAAQAITLADGGDYLRALLWLVVLAALVPVLFGVWAVVLDRGITTAESSGAAGGKRGRRRAQRGQGGRGMAGARVVATSSATGGLAVAPTIAPPGALTRLRRRLISNASLAIAGKDLRYFWRDPQLKASLLSSLLVMLLIFAPNLFGGFGSGSDGGAYGATPFSSMFSPFETLFATLPALLIALSFSTNMFGLERQGVQTLFLFPVRALDIYWGKNLAIGGVALTTQVVMTLAIAAVTGGWAYVPLTLVAGAAALLTLLGCGNVTSTLIPFRVRQMRMGANNMSGENGFLRGILSIGMVWLTFLLLTPVVAALGLPLLLNLQPLLILTLPLALAYGIAIHQIATRLIAPRLIARAPEMLAKLTRES